MEVGDLVGFSVVTRGTRGFLEVTGDQNNNFSVVEETGGKWRYVPEPNYSPRRDEPRNRVKQTVLDVYTKFICMDVGLMPSTHSHWCVLLVVEKGRCVFSSRADDLFETIAKGNQE